METNSPRAWIRVAVTLLSLLAGASLGVFIWRIIVAADVLAFVAGAGFVIFGQAGFILSCFKAPPPPKDPERPLRIHEP